MNLILFQQYSEKDIYTPSFHYLDSHFFPSNHISPNHIAERAHIKDPNGLHVATCKDHLLVSIHLILQQNLDQLLIPVSLKYHLCSKAWIPLCLVTLLLLWPLLPFLLCRILLIFPTSKLRSDQDSTLRLYFFTLYAQAVGDLIHS